jgi:hypothetical protein
MQSSSLAMKRVVLVMSALLDVTSAVNYWSGRCDVCWPGNRNSQCGGDVPTGADRGCGFAGWGCEYECVRTGQTTDYWTGQCDTCFSWNRDSQCSGATYGATGTERGCGFLNAGCEYHCRRNCPNVVCPAGQERMGWCGGQWNNYWCQAIPNYVSPTSEDAQPPPREVWDALGVTVPASVASIVGDPHLSLPHGGLADFRGEDKAIYNFLTAKGFSLNVLTELADFELHPANHSRHKDVHGSFLTQAHIVARTSTGKIVRASFFAAAIENTYFPNGLPTNKGYTNGTVDSGPAFELYGSGAGFKHEEVKVVDGVQLKQGYSSLNVLTPEFEIVISPVPFRLERNVVGMHHRLDVTIKPRVAESAFAVPPHGIIGQGWDGDNKAIDGEQDAFPGAGEFTTYAMAKGAIEGVPNDYKLATKYATDFKYSRFDATSAEPRNVAKLVAAGELNTPKTVYGADVVGSKEITEENM